MRRTEPYDPGSRLSKFSFLSKERIGAIRKLAFELRERGVTVKYVEQGNTKETDVPIGDVLLDVLHALDEIDGFVEAVTGKPYHHKKSLLNLNRMIGLDGEDLVRQRKPLFDALREEANRLYCKSRFRR